MYADKFKKDVEFMKKKLWGDVYFDNKEKKWTTNEVGADGKALTRTFNQFIMDPIIKLSRAIMEGNKE